MANFSTDSIVQTILYGGQRSSADLMLCQERQEFPGQFLWRLLCHVMPAVNPASFKGRGPGAPNLENVAVKLCQVVP